MSHLRFALPRFVLFAAVASIASAGMAAQQSPGSYQLSFHHSVGGTLEAVSTLPVCTDSACEELILKAHVEDGSGAPAQSGLVTFQYCALKGLPPNDISRPDEAPKSACETRAGTWANLATLQVDGSGDAHLNFGLVLIPRTVGFRFRFTRGSGISKGVSAARDFVWVPAE